MKLTPGLKYTLHGPKVFPTYLEWYVQVRHSRVKICISRDDYFSPSGALILKTAVTNALRILQASPHKGVKIRPKV